MQPGIYDDLTIENYHAGPGISKSGLWTIHTKSARHFRFPAIKEPKPHFAVGDAIHRAILEPHKFEKDFHRGPEDRRGNKWKDAEEFCKAKGKTLLRQDDFDKALDVRDVVLSDPFLRGIIDNENALVENSIYWTDPTTGVLCRCRPDLYRPDIGVMLDIKSTVSAAPSDFARSIDNYGYHVQEAMYGDGIDTTFDGPFNGTLFLALEKEEPYATGLYELKPSAVAEGFAIYRQALERYAACLQKDEWPAYGDGVQELDIPGWAYRHTERPSGDDDAV